MSNNLPENLEETASYLLLLVHYPGRRERSRHPGRVQAGGHVPWPASPARGAAESQSQHFASNPEAERFSSQLFGVWDYWVH